MIGNKIERIKMGIDMKKWGTQSGRQTAGVHMMEKLPFCFIPRAQKNN